MLAAEPSTPAPTYGSPTVSSRPWIVPSSPNGPCSTGNTTSISPAPEPFASTSAPPPAPGTSDVPPPGASSAGGTPRPAASSGRGAVDDLPAAAGVDQQRHDVVAPGIERLDHRAGRGQGDRVLGRAAARDHGDAQAVGHGGAVGDVTGWSNCPIESTTTNGLVFVPSMFWSCTTPSWPASLTGVKMVR